MASDDLSKDLTKILREEELSGSVWMTIDPLKGTRIGAAGLSDVENHISMQIHNNVHMGSITKTVLATAVLRMVSLGLLDLDKPVTDYLNNVSFDNPWPHTSVTIRHLLDHTSGLEDARLWQMFSNEVDPEAPLINSFPTKGRKLKIRSRPGEIFSYSNSGYGLLGLVIESVTGERYETYLDKMLLAPLGMTGSTFTFLKQETSPNLAWGHFDDGTQSAAHPIALRPAGQFTTTMADMAKLAHFMMGNGMLPNGQKFVEEELMKSRGKPYRTIAAQKGLLPAYTLGLARRDRHGVVSYCHTGNIIGYYAMFCLFPEEQKAFAFSVNTDSETADYTRIASRLIASISPQNAISEGTKVLPADIDDWVGYYVLQQSRFDMFRYLDVAFGFAKIDRRQDNIVFSPFQGQAYSLDHLGDNLYRADNRSTISHLLYRDKMNVPHISNGFTTYQKVNSLLIIGHVGSVFIGCIGFVGLLILALINIRKMYNGELVAMRPVTLGILALVLPMPLFMMYPFTSLGDLTIANAVLTGATALFPILILYSLFKLVRQPVNRGQSIYFILNLAILQWIIVMFIYGQWPLVLWA
jgi:CubicO group peptidase (beta-lactamase class C family)